MAKYDKDIDYQKVINDSVAKGDYSSAAEAEASRNAKIKDLGLDYKISNSYEKYREPVYTNPVEKPVYSAMGNYNDSDMSVSDKDLIQKYKDSWNNATTQEDKDAYHLAAEKLREKYGYSGGDDGSDYIGFGKPKTNSGGYDSTYSNQIDSILDQILNRKPFDYDYKQDPQYHAYADQYKRLGDRAREDVIGDVASLTGGYGSSWAVSAGSQAQNDYNQQLSGVIPELYQAAYGKYKDEYNMDLSNLGAVMGVDGMYYDRYRDDVSDSQWQQQFDFNKDQSEIGNNQWQQEFDFNKGQTETGNNQWQQNFEYNKQQDLLDRQANDDSMQYSKMLDKWQQLGYATDDVAKYFGISEGTQTSSYYFNLAELAMQKEKAVSSASKSESYHKDTVLRRAKSALDGGMGMKIDGVYADEQYESGALSILNSDGIDENDYYSLGQEIGIPVEILDKVLEENGVDNSADETKKQQAEFEKQYNLLAREIANQEDPEKWLMKQLATGLINADMYIELKKFL